MESPTQGNLDPEKPHLPACLNKSFKSCQPTEKGSYTRGQSRAQALPFQGMQTDIRDVELAVIAAGPTHVAALEAAAAAEHAAAVAALEATTTSSRRATTHTATRSVEARLGFPVLGHLSTYSPQYISALVCSPREHRRDVQADSGCSRSKLRFGLVPWSHIPQFCGHCQLFSPPKEVAENLPASLQIPRT